MRSQALSRSSSIASRALLVREPSTPCPSDCCAELASYAARRSLAGRCRPLWTRNLPTCNRCTQRAAQKRRLVARHEGNAPCFVPPRACVASGYRMLLAPLLHLLKGHLERNRVLCCRTWAQRAPQGAARALGVGLANGVYDVAAARATQGRRDTRSVRGRMTWTQPVSSRCVRRAEAAACCSGRNPSPGRVV